jgi:hypothetical protein
LTWTSAGSPGTGTATSPASYPRLLVTRSSSAGWPRATSEAALPTGSDQQPDEYLPLVLRTFIWGFPHQYHAPAPPGTTIALEISGIGAWTLARTAAGWILDEGQAAAPAASLGMSGEAAWRLLTGGRYDARQVELSGDPALAEPLLQVRGVIV